MIHYGGARLVLLATIVSALDVNVSKGTDDDSDELPDCYSGDNTHHEKAD